MKWCELSEDNIPRLLEVIYGGEQSDQEWSSVDVDLIKLPKDTVTSIRRLIGEA